MLRRIVYVLLITVAIISIAAGLNQIPDRFTKNIIGDSQEFGRCPNCNDSFWWKPASSLQYSETRVIIICKDCLTHPEKLSEDRIKKNLLACSWTAEKAALIHQAVKEYKIKRGIGYL